MHRLALNLAALTLLALGACSPARQAPPQAKLLPRPVTPLPQARLERQRAGPPEKAGAGDFVLANGLLSAVVLGLGHGLRAGELIALGQRPGRPAGLSLRVFVGNESITFERAYADRGDRTSLRFAGRVAANSHIRAWLHYSLQRGARRLRLSLKLEALRQDWRGRLRVAIAFRRGRVFSPGHPYGRLPRRCEGWFELHGRDTSFGVPCSGRDSLLLTPSGAVLLDRPLTLRAGEAFSRELSIVVGGPTWSAALRALLDPRADQARSHLLVLDERGEPLAGALVGVWRDERPVAFLSTGVDGHGSMPLPPGRYRFGSIGRGRLATLEAEVPAAGGRWTLRAGPPSQLVFDLRTPSGREEPIQLDLKRLQGPPLPLIPPVSPLSGASTIIAPLGRGVLSLPPGKYRLRRISSSGTVASHALALRPYQGGEWILRPLEATARPRCDLLIAPRDARGLSAQQERQWLAASGCTGTKKISELSAPNASLLARLGAPYPLLFRAARPGDDLRFLARLVDVPGQRSRCRYYSEGPTLQFAEGSQGRVLRVDPPAGARMGDAFLAGPTEIHPLEATSAGTGRVYRLPREAKWRWFATSARVGGDRVLLLLWPFAAECILPSSKGASGK